MWNIVASSLFLFFLTKKLLPSPSLLFFQSKENGCSWKKMDHSPLKILSAVSEFQEVKISPDLNFWINCLLLPNGKKAVSVQVSNWCCHFTYFTSVNLGASILLQIYHFGCLCLSFNESLPLCWFFLISYSHLFSFSSN